MADFPSKWILDSVGGIQTLSIGTDLNSKISGSQSLISTSINNKVDTACWTFIALEVTLGSITTAAGAGFAIYAMASLDDSVYPGVDISGAVSAVNNVGVVTGTGAKVGTLIMPIPGLYFKLVFGNNLGVTTAASGNSIRYQFMTDGSRV